MRVYIDMAADLFHAGHIRALKKAKAFGDYLIVGIHSDAVIASYKRQPIIPEQYRYELVRHINIVDEVIEDAPISISKEYIKKYKIDIVAAGDDHTPAQNEQMYKIPMEMGIMRFFSYTKGISTSQLIEKIINRHNL